MPNLMIAFLLTLFAGLSTGIGSIIAFMYKKTNTTFLSVSLGFSAGVMIYVSFVEILNKAEESLISAFGPSTGQWATLGTFFLGIFIISVIDRFVPEFENPHQPRSKEELNELETETIDDKSKLHRMGILSALAIAIHNFPEGLATFAATLSDPALGLSIAIAVAIHNIPEGISVSVPIYFSTGSKKKAFIYSFLSGLAEPAGAVIGFFLLRIIFNEFMFGVLFGVVAGIMIYISIDELLPTSREYGKGHQEIYGFIAGMAVMGISLVLF